MKQVYQGIFSAEVTLFYGEKIVYRIIEDRNGVIRESEEMVCAWEEQDSKGDNCKYALLNRLARYPYEKTVKTYLEQECLVEEFFTLK